MHKRFQNVNKYRNAVGSVGKNEQWYPDIPIGTSSSDCSSLIQANSSWIAINWSGGGSIGLLPLDRPGKGCAAHAKVFQAHGASISDWHFSPFDEHLLATGAEDAMVKLWKIPGVDDEWSDPICSSTLTTSSRRVDMVRFHPTADQILSTLGNDGKKVSIWNIEKSACAYDLTGSTPIHSFSWKSDGSLIATTGKDALNVWDPRAEEKLIQTGPGHQGIKGARVVWLNDSNYIFTVGMNKMRSRQYGIWDTRDLSKPYLMQSLDTSTGTLLPLYDDDTETMYLVSRGDATIRSLQLSNVSTNPTVSDNMICGTNTSLLGATLLPKTKLDVMHTEISRLLTVTNNSVIPVSYNVPRKQYIDFHSDLFPDTKGSVPALSSTDWFAGKTCQVATVSLDPFKKQIPQPCPDKGITNNKGSQQQPSSPASAATTNEKQHLETKSTKPALPQEGSLDQEQGNATSVSAPTPVTSTTPSPSPINQSPSSSTPTTFTMKKTLPKYGTVNPSIYKYITNKTYHPSTHYEDLKGLNFNKSGTTELIQANAKYIATPLDGPGGRIGIISTCSSTGARLPPRLPCIVTGADVTYFQFDPFNPHVLATVSDDNKIRLFSIPEDGLTDDLSEAIVTLQDSHMDKVNLLAFHPNAKHILATASHDLGKPTIRIWNTSSTLSPELILTGTHHDTILAMAWRPDGKAIATYSKDKQLRVVDARTGELLGKTKTHEGIRPSRLIWLDDHQHLVSVGFGLGSMREILVFDTLDLSKPLTKRSIDVSPSIMNAYYDRDCKILYVAGKGDRTIHSYEVENDFTLTPLAKMEFGSLQQGFAFLPKRHCNVKELEIDKFYRLTSTTIEPVGIHVPRARPEFFQDDIFIPTLDVEHSTHDATDWIQGKDKSLERISMQPQDMTPLSQAPPPPNAARSKAKFESGKKQVSEDQQRQDTMNRMFATAKDVDQEDEDRKAKESILAAEDQDVDDDEWDD
ncbi:hypothetical protein BC941DRAFT_442318 [Chlamydoabsidia padenii]|nr:hypothetical protein BC941DRAFT_442318 [Chlamydoabsidia padenii]